MGLPWVRLDINLPTHDKIINLTDSGSKIGYQSAFSYVCSLTYCGMNETDGYIPNGALRHIHGTKKTAELLVEHGLWDVSKDHCRPGWVIPHWAERQPTKATIDATHEAKRAASRKGNCRKNHPAHCWTDTAGCSQWGK